MLVLKAISIVRRVSFYDHFRLPPDPI